MTTALQPTHQPEVLVPIVNWEHWDTIKRVAQKEYGITAAEFEEALPEYQRFLGLIRAGNSNIGMYSEQVDKIWHSHILCSTLYVSFCEAVFGHYIHHVPNIAATGQDCVSPDPCASKCLSICKTPPPKCTEGERHPTSAVTFAQAYLALYGIQPPAIWSLSIADGWHE
jgi:hypothetical protein